MKVNKRLFFAPLLLAGLPFCQSKAQVTDPRFDSLYVNVISWYTSLYTTIMQEGNMDRKKFVSLFEPDARIDNDFSQLPGRTKVFHGAGSYVDNILTIFEPTNKAEFSDFQAEVSPASKMILCLDDHNYYVWINKRISYKVKGIPLAKPIDTWVRLKIHQMDRVYKIKEIILDEKPNDVDNDKIADSYIEGAKCDYCLDSKKGVAVNIKGCPELDYDQDGTPDKLDDCPTEAGPKRTHGCPDKDHDGVKDSEDECPDRKGAKVNKGCPISGLVLSAQGGAMLPFGTGYSSKTPLDNSKYQWSGKSNLAGYGILYGLSIRYQFSTVLGLEAGGMNFSNQFDAKRMQLNIQTFLARNNLAYTSVAVSSNATQYNMAYLKACLGDFRNSTTLFLFEPTVGVAFPGFTNNETIIRVNYQDGQQQVSSINFNSNAILLYGVSAKYEWWLAPSVFGLALNAYLLTGQTDFAAQEVKFADNPGTLTFSNQRMQLAGASIGLMFYVGKGKISYQHENSHRYD